MSNVTQAETEVGATVPTKTKCHIYAVGGNSISTGPIQYNNDVGGVQGLTAPMRTKYWDALHDHVWRLHTTQFGQNFAVGNFQPRQVQKLDEITYNTPETYAMIYSSPMIVFPRLRELYSNSIDIGFCHAYGSGTGFRDIATVNWNAAEPDPYYGTLNLTKQLSRQLDLIKKHMEAMGYDVEVKGILMMGQSVIDVNDLVAAAYSKAQIKTDITAVVNYFRTTLGYTDIPFYFTETTTFALYPAECAVWNEAVTELNTELGNIYIQYPREWQVLGPDNTHIDGRTGVLCWGEGAETNGHKNMAELIHSIETA